MSEPMRIRATLQGDVADVRIIMMHPMETGNRKDAKGEAVPLHFIQSAVKRSSTIIDALLRLSRAGRIEYTNQHVNLTAMVNRIVDAMRVTIEARDRSTINIAARSRGEDMQGLVHHLRLTGQLTAGLILRALLSSNLDLFDAALAELADLPLARVSALLHERGGNSLQLSYTLSSALWDGVGREATLRSLRACACATGARPASKWSKPTS